VVVACFDSGCLFVVVKNDDISIAGFRSVGKHAIVGIAGLLEKLRYRIQTKHLLIKNTFTEIQILSQSS
jgi:hypothetical protein